MPIEWPPKMIYVCPHCGRPDGAGRITFQTFRHKDFGLTSVSGIHVRCECGWFGWATEMDKVVASVLPIWDVRVEFK